MDVKIFKKNNLSSSGFYSSSRQQKGNYLDLAREQKKQWNMKMIMIPVVVGVLGTVTKDLEKRLEGVEIARKIETIHTTTLKIS